MAKKKELRKKTLSPKDQEKEEPEKPESPQYTNDEPTEPEIDKLIEDLTSLGESVEEFPAKDEKVQLEEEPLPGEGEEEPLPFEDEEPHTGEEEEPEIPKEGENNFNLCPNCGRELFSGQCLFCAERLADMEGYKEVEEETPEDEVYSLWREEMRQKGELNIIGIFCVVVASIYMIYISYPEVLQGLTGEFDLEHFTFYFFLLVIGLGALFGGFVMARHVIIYGRLFDTTFEREIYSRLEPAFAEVGGIRGDLQELYERMERMNLHMKRMEKRVLSSTNGGSADRELNSSTRYIFLMILTLAVFFYVLRAPGEYVIYVTTAMFLIWWVGITSDYRLWRVSVAWTWAFFAVFVVPVASMLSSVVFGISLMIGILGIALTLYALSYYSWAKYYVEGVAPDFLPSLKEEE
ncbi:MAG: hypothetical protein JSW28_04345 [Thermoplasmata archaeon]|nr:MAG: hypothetical protein JSW28_04345 [Thermoplasmata archaeon]